MTRAATATPPASKTKSSGWDDAAVKLLTDAVAKAPTASAAFEEVAEKLGKTKGTVQQKYYNMQKKANGGKPSAKSVGRGKSAARVRADTDWSTYRAEELDAILHSIDTELTRREVADAVAKERARLKQEADAEKAKLDEALAAKLAKFEADAIAKARAEN